MPADVLSRTLGEAPEQATTGTPSGTRVRTRSRRAVFLTWLRKIHLYVVWADQEVLQPERWSVSLQSPVRGVNAEYFVGNCFVKIDHIDATPIGTLTRLHMSVGVNVFRVLLSDTIASGLVLLSITGLLLWTQLHTARTIAVMTSVGALLASVWFMWSV